MTKQHPSCSLSRVLSIGGPPQEAYFSFILLPNAMGLDSSFTSAIRRHKHRIMRVDTENLSKLTRPSEPYFFPALLALTALTALTGLMGLRV